MDDPIRLFTTTVLLASAAYVVLSNLQFRRRWPETMARSRDRVLSAVAGFNVDRGLRLQLAEALADVERGRGVMVFVTACAGAIAGGIAGALLNVALMVAQTPPRADHGVALGAAGAVFFAIAFAALATEE